MQTADFSAGGTFLASLFCGFTFIGSATCALASPWQAMHIDPLASFLAPCAVIAVEACWLSWQLAQIGVGGCCAHAGAASNSVASTAPRSAANRLWNLIGLPLNRWSGAERAQRRPALVSIREGAASRVNGV